MKHGLGDSLAQENVVYEIEMNKDDITVNGTTYEFTSHQLASNYNIYLFGRNNKGVCGNICKARIYQVTIKDNGEIVKNFIPCISSEGNIGLYDTVSGSFYGNNSNSQVNFIVPNNDVGNYNYQDNLYYIPFHVTGKNKANYEGVINLADVDVYEKIDNGFVYEYKANETYNNSRIAKIPCELKKDRKYTISYTVETVGTVTKSISVYYPESPTKYFGVGKNSGRYSVTVRADKDRNYIGLSVMKDDYAAGVKINITNIQIEDVGQVDGPMGDTVQETLVQATEYEPFFKNSYNIAINQPLRKLSDSVFDYIDFASKKVVRNVQLKDGRLSKLDTPIEENVTIPNINLENVYYILTDTDVTPSNIMFYE